MLTDARETPTDLELQAVLEAEAGRLVSGTGSPLDSYTIASRLIAEQTKRTRRALRRRALVLVAGLLAVSSPLWRNPAGSPNLTPSQQVSTVPRQGARAREANALPILTERLSIGGNPSHGVSDVAVVTESVRPVTPGIVHATSVPGEGRWAGIVRTVKLSELNPAERLAVQALYGLPQRPEVTPPF